MKCRKVNPKPFEELLLLQLADGFLFLLIKICLGDFTVSKAGFESPGCPNVVPIVLNDTGPKELSRLDEQEFAEFPEAWFMC